MCVIQYCSFYNTILICHVVIDSTQILKRFAFLQSTEKQLNNIQKRLSNIVDRLTVLVQLNYSNDYLCVEILFIFTEDDNMNKKCRIKCSKDEPEHGA